MRLTSTTGNSPVRKMLAMMSQSKPSLARIAENRFSNRPRFVPTVAALSREDSLPRRKPIWFILTVFIIVIAVVTLWVIHGLY